MKSVTYTNLRRLPVLPPISRYINLIDGEWLSLDPLLPVANRLRGLLLNTTVADISGLSHFRELRELAVSEYCSGGFSLAGLPAMDSLWVDVGPSRRISLDGGSVLRKLGLANATRPWATWIGDLPGLEDLRLDSPRNIPEVLPSALRSLELSGVRRWSEQGWAMTGPGELRELRLVNVRGMVDLSSFAFAESLELLWLEDCGELRSIEGPGLSADVKVLRVGCTPAPREPTGV